jgi:rhodanese-related sulfurtransferase
LADSPESVNDLLAEARRELVRLSPRDALSACADGAVLIDIRSDAQRAAGVIPSAVCIPRNVLEWRLDPGSDHRDPELARHGTRVVLFCNQGYQSSLAAANVRRFGVDATDVIGGFQAWREAGLPVERP